MKKILALLLCLTMALAACGAALAENPVVAPTKTIKIGVEIYDPTDQEFLVLKDYFDNYLAPAMNLEFIYSEAIADADGEFAFIDNCAAAGCDAIMGYYNISGAEAAWRAIENGMYYSYGEQALYDELKTEPKYLNGIIYGDNGNYEAGKAMGEALAATGAKKIVYSNGGTDFGVQMFIDRTAGFMENNGGAEVITVSGFPGTDAFASQQSSALTTEGVDAVATSFNALLAWVQPIAAAGLDVPVATIGVVSDEFVAAMEAGQIDCLVAANIERYALQIAMIYQAINGEKILDDNGNAPMIVQAYLTFTDAGDCKAYSELMKNGHIYSAEDLMGCTSYARLVELMNSYTLEDVAARRAS